MAWLRERSGDVRALAVAIEIPHGPVVEALLEAGIAVYAINPKAVDRFRDRHSVAGAKDDRRDAFVLAEALHTDRAKFTRVQPPDATTLLLREVGRTYDALQHDRTCFRNRLRELAQRAYPDLLPLCPAANAPWFWDLLEGVTTKRRLRRDWVTRLLARHRKRAVSVEAVLAAVRTPALALTPGTYEALALAMRSTTFGQLAIQLVTWVAGGAGVYVCDGCELPYLSEKRPRRDRKNFSDQCRTDKVPAKMRQAKKRRLDAESKIRDGAMIDGELEHGEATR